MASGSLSGTVSGVEVLVYLLLTLMGFAKEFAPSKSEELKDMDSTIHIIHVIMRDWPYWPLWMSMSGGRRLRRGTQSFKKI